MTSFQELKNFIENEPNILQQYVNVQSGGEVRTVWRWVCTFLVCELFKKAQCSYLVYY